MASLIFASYASSSITPPYSHSQSVTVQGPGEEELLCEDTQVWGGGGGGGEMGKVIIIIALQLFLDW